MHLHLHVSSKYLLRLLTLGLSIVPGVAAASPFDNHMWPCVKKVHNELEAKGYEVVMSLGDMPGEGNQLVSFKWNADDNWTPCSFSESSLPSSRGASSFIADGYKCGSVASFLSSFGTVSGRLELRARDGQLVATKFVGGKTMSCQLSSPVRINNRPGFPGQYGANYNYSAIYKFTLDDRRAGVKSFYIKEQRTGVPSSSVAPPLQF